MIYTVTNYRIFSRTAVPKTPDSTWYAPVIHLSGQRSTITNKAPCLSSLGIVLSGPGVFRAGLLMTALHYSWLSPSGSLANTDMEETYLYHKLEAMRHVNELVADPESCTTDECIGLIAALAMAEVCNHLLFFMSRRGFADPGVVTERNGRYRSGRSTSQRTLYPRQHETSRGVATSLLGNSPASDPSVCSCSPSYHIK